jgi:hypothetical protein
MREVAVSDEVRGGVSTIPQLSASSQQELVGTC